MEYIIIGAGSRGMTYGLWAKEHGIKIAAIAEIRPERLKSAAKELGVPENRQFSDARELLSLGKIADAAIIATMDRDHYGHVMQALDCGYDILLEKPISPDPKECAIWKLPMFSACLMATTFPISPESIISFNCWKKLV